jgi:hypothetical protein
MGTSSRDGGPGNAVKTPGWAPFYPGVDAFFAPGEPTGLLKLGKMWVEATAGLSRKPHQLEPVARLSWIFKKNLDHIRHPRCEVKVHDRNVHGS